MLDLIGVALGLLFYLFFFADFALDLAAKLDEMLQQEGAQIDKVVNLDIEDELLIKRVTGRVIHKESGRTYNIYFNPPKVAGKDDVCKTRWICRGDEDQ